MPTARIVRGSVLSIKEKEFVEAATCVGSNRGKILAQHIFPNVLSPIIVSATIGVAAAILNESALSFLGVGIRPPGAAWGSMVSDGYQYLLSNPILSFAPGFAIMLVVLAFNIVGDGLRDALDPRLRGTI